RGPDPALSPRRIRRSGRGTPALLRRPHACEDPTPAHGLPRADALGPAVGVRRLPLPRRSSARVVPVHALAAAPRPVTVTANGVRLRMRFLHTGDWHIGKMLKGRNRLDEQTAVLAEIVDIACRERVDALLLGGDVFDSFAPSPEAERLVYATLADCCGGGIPVV